KAVPGRRAVAADASGGYLLLEQRERGPDAAEELRPRHGGELPFGVVDVVDVDRFEPEIGEAPPELVLQVAWRHGVRSDDVLRTEDAGAHVGVAHEGRRVRRNGPVEGDVAALGAHHHLVAPEVTLP